ncbi:DNA topoisomerase 3 [Xanthomonas theicola]|uniref:DNA topoisomerase n=1 Tax=Xanthomonas theicola TaxID=56464 RepID=A0A2S6ZGT2_9XANT|nr:DNA topoisomerase 3 [Xanthomonas theicola]PPT91426.1 DNA topoisomerase III [Xanthomonas theicola]QNH27230.1 DNA topoisomerase III [Xanthomonas theicola]
MRVWLTEKPDQARELAPLLGNPRKARGFFDTDDGRVVWAYGHVMRQAAPEDYGDAWAKWTPEALPMVPATWATLPDDGEQYKRDQIAVIGQCLKGATEVVIATDCDAEGEAIARELLEHFRFRGGVKRLWYNATDERSMRKALASLRDGAETLPMYWSAQARSRADWLIGMNLTRAYTLLAKARGGQGVRSIGRVQTPTLSLVVRRDRAIEQFTSRSYYELEADARLANGQAVRLRYAPADEARIFDRDQAQQLAQQCEGARGPLTVEQEEKTTAPPKLFSMARLQKAASSKWGWSADKTLEVAQALYDVHKLTTYPRAGAVYLPDEQVPEIPLVAAALGTIGPLAPHVAAITVNGPVVRPSVFNTKKLEGEPHHAIIPTVVTPDPAKLTDDERALYLLIAQHYLAALLPDYRYAETRLGFAAGGVTFGATGRVPLAQGWRAVFGGADPERDEDAEDDSTDLPAIIPNAQATLAGVSIAAKKTRPPRRYTEGDLIADMAAIAKYATDPAIKARLRETSGIGTEATRASIIASLRERGYLEPQGKFIVSTAVGREHCDGIDPGLADPAMTAVWEDVLHAMRGGKLPETARDEFVGKIAGNVTRLVEVLRPHIDHAIAHRAPSEQQLAYARKLAAELGIAVPAEAERSFATCKAFIDAYRDRVAALPPTPAAVAFAEKIATAAGVALPAEARTSRDACSGFIEAHKKSLPTTAKGGKRKAKKAKK